MTHLQKRQRTQRNVSSGAFAIAAVMLLAIMLCGCGQKESATTEVAPVVTGEVIQFAPNDQSLNSIATAKVSEPNARELTIPGRIVWDEDRTVRSYSPFSGRVEKLLVDVGTKVGVGQPLAYIQSPDFGVAQTEARKADATFKVAKAQLTRAKELAANGIVSTKDLQQAEADFAAADAEVRRSSARLQLYASRSDAPNSDQRFALSSPLAGLVVERNLNPGQELKSDQSASPQFVVTDPTRLWVQLDASETDLKHFRTGMPVLISSVQYPDDAFRGELTLVSDFIDPVTRTLKLRAKITNADRRLKAEMFVNARIALEKDDFLSVPDKAVYLEGMRNFVFVKVGEGKFARTAVRAGPNTGGMVPILSGLKPGAEVVVGGSLFLQQTVASAQLRNEIAAKANSTGEKGGSASAGSAKP
jgi:cobalt-zinc-cadmium efflux system membrane fusion protein